MYSQVTFVINCFFDVSLMSFVGRLRHVQSSLHPSDSVREEEDDGLHGQVRHQPQEHPQLPAQELNKGRNNKTNRAMITLIS